MRDLPFTADAFLAVFTRYNEAIGPYVPLLLWLLAAFGLLAATRRGRREARLAFIALALLWLWSGAVYHWLFFRRLESVGALFAILFATQGALLVWRGSLRADVPIEPRRDWQTVLGASIVVYAMLLYPLVGLALGHRAPAAPTFGAPCPVVMLTLGVLMLARPRPPLALLLIPVGWALVATSAAVRLGMWEDLGLPAAAVLVLATVLRQRAGRRPVLHAAGAVAR